MCLSIEAATRRVAFGFHAIDDCISDVHSRLSFIELAGRNIRQRIEPLSKHFPDCLPPSMDPTLIRDINEELFNIALIANQIVLMKSKIEQMEINVWKRCSSQQPYREMLMKRWKSYHDISDKKDRLLLFFQRTQSALYGKVF